MIEDPSSLSSIGSFVFSTCRKSLSTCRCSSRNMVNASMLRMYPAQRLIHACSVEVDQPRQAFQDPVEEVAHRGDGRRRQDEWCGDGRHEARPPLLSPEQTS